MVSLPGANVFLGNNRRDINIVVTTDPTNVPNAANLNGLYSDGRLYLNPNSPEQDKPLLNVIIHELDHEKLPGYGIKELPVHLPEFFAILNAQLIAFGIKPDPEHDLRLSATQKYYGNTYKDIALPKNFDPLKFFVKGGDAVSFDVPPNQNNVTFLPTGIPEPAGPTGTPATSAPYGGNFGTGYAGSNGMGGNNIGNGTPTGGVAGLYNPPLQNSGSSNAGADSSGNASGPYPGSGVTPNGGVYQTSPQSGNNYSSQGGGANRGGGSSGNTSGSPTPSSYQSSGNSGNSYDNGAGGGGGMGYGGPTGNYGPSTSNSVSNSTHDYGTGAARPILLDLSGKGIKITELSRSTTFMDSTGSGLSHRTAWAGVGTGVLFYDVNGTGQITQKNQYVFTEWDPTAKDDMQALRDVFDSNGDGVFNASDAKWSQFKVMVTNADGLKSYAANDNRLKRTWQIAS